MAGASDRLDPAAAAAQLGALPVFDRIVAEVGPVRLGDPVVVDGDRTAGHFVALVRAVVFQQLAGAAATTIHERLVTALGGDVTPDAVLEASDGTLRTAGLSRRKAETITDLARHVGDGRVDLTAVDELDDEEVVVALTDVRGIGVWTAQMFLIFQLHRPDVWPVGDLGVRRGYALLHGLEEPPRAAMLEHLGEPYRPWRTAAAWYCWRAVDVAPPGADPWS